MRPKRITLTPAVADPNGIAEAQTTAGAANLTLDGALSGTMDVPRHVSIACAANISAVGFTVTGTDRLGNAITEAITGPNATTVTGVKNFKTVTQVAVDGAVGTNCEVGSADEMETQWVPLNRLREIGTVQVEFTATGALTYALQTTTDDVQANGFQENDAGTTVDGTMTGETASSWVNASGYATAARLAVTGHTASGFTAAFMQGLS